METMKELLRGIFYIATMDREQPRVRAFDSCVEFENKFYFETASNKNVYRQLKDNPKVEIIAHGSIGTVRITAEAYEEGDARVIDGVEREVGKYLNNPELAVFRLENANAVLTYGDGKVQNFQF